MRAALCYTQTHTGLEANASGLGGGWTASTSNAGLPTVGAHREEVADARAAVVAANPV